jgi:mono/diheme cytochrome c family protein
MLVRILAALLGASTGFAQAPDALKVMRANCFPCHSTANSLSGLALDSAEAFALGGNRGPAKQFLLDAIQQRGDLKMPPGRKLKDEQIQAIEAWLNAGASYPPEMAKAKKKGADHWAFQPIRNLAADPANSIDKFILDRLALAKLKPSPEAARSTLLRRVTYDLTGLIPTAQELRDFLADTQPGAYERVVDRLLASPHYGEHQARHWLDLARYSDTDGYTIDAPREIWKYRDWVIDAYNRDMPFDQFTIEQIAGDLLPKPTQAQLIATGFHRNTPSNYEGGIDFEQYRVEAVADRVATTGAVWMGLTLGCARCHDHKFDPVSQREFFQLFAFFNHSDEIETEAERKDFNRPFLEMPTELEATKLRAWEGQMRALRAELAEFEKGTAPELRKYNDEWAERMANITALEKRRPKITSTLIWKDRAQPRETRVHIGGEFTRPGIPVQEGTPAVLPPLEARGKLTRLELARWLVDTRNPLTARVTVNRVWQRLFGHGIVDTENDFGLQGEKPSHPELLDYLASSFQAKGWSQKQLLQEIVTSSTYKQASEFRADAAAVDPDNRLLARQARLRMDAEAIRDASLVASGLMTRTVGGRSVFPPIPEGALRVTQVDRGWKTETGPNRYRRGIYTFRQRSALHPSLAVFDAPDGVVACTRRIRSNSPLQALTLLNDQAHVEMAQAFAKLLEKEGVGAAYLAALSRRPSAQERDRVESFLAAKQDYLGAARALLNLDEFMTRE